MKATFYSILILLVFSIFVSCGPDTASAESKEVVTAQSANDIETKLSQEFMNLKRAMANNPNNHNENGSFANRIAKEYL